MPRVAADGSSPSWDKLFEIAAAQDGYVTNTQAAEAGYSLPLIQFHIHAGRLERAQRGILRLVHYPAGEHEDLVVLWLWSQQQGVFSHDTALMLHDLSDALPAKRHMTVPSVWSKRRLRLPKGLILHFADISKAETTWLGPVPFTTALRTVIECAMDHVSEDFVRQATHQGIRRKLFTRAELNAGLRARRQDPDAAIELRNP